MTLICMGVFACTNYLEQQSKTFVDMSKVQLIQLDEPESDAPAMKITTTAGTIVAELFPEQAPAYVKQFTELAESGYYDDTYVSRWKRVYTSKQAAPMQTARWTAMQTAPMKK